MSPLTRTSNFPLVVINAAAVLAAHYASTRECVFIASMRAVIARPPAAPVAYPSLVEAERKVELRVPPILRPALDDAEARWFYGRLAWLCLYGMRRRPEGLRAALDLSVQGVTVLDTVLADRYLSSSRGHTCPPQIRTARPPLAPRR